MTAIAGINRPDQTALVERMLEQMNHRGPEGQEILTGERSTLGVAWSAAQTGAQQALHNRQAAQDAGGPGRMAEACLVDGRVILRRDEVGIAPLYYGWTATGHLCFASEAKGLLVATRDIQELLPGHTLEGGRMLPYYTLSHKTPLDEPPEVIIAELRRRLEAAVLKGVARGEVGAWLSGGIDSSALAALAARHVPGLHTFVAGLPGAPDLEYATQVAQHIGARHHELIVQPGDLPGLLSEVIQQLETFDALLLRSSILNFHVARLASEYVPAVFSGEGGDELFAGYDYLKALPIRLLPGELLDITGRLHNTALQRVDRCASGHGTLAYTAFLDPEVLAYALRIPAGLKLHDGMEKWVLRMAVSDLLPEDVLWRPKAKFWEGSGVQELLSDYAEQQVSDADFARRRFLLDGTQLNSKEELLYYRLFREHFGDFTDLSWIGRTKQTPVQ